MRTFILSSFVLFAVISLSSCSNENALTETSPVELKSTFADITCTDSVFTTTVEDLTQADIDGLMFMREEEKLAHDVYVHFYGLYSLQIFDRISSSESQHAEAVLRLLNYFGLEDPTIDEAGVFTSTELQSLYNELIALGGESVESALTVGALIEETDIEDLENIITETENTDIQTVYANLLNGSYKHLKAFVRVLSSYDVTYEPQILTQEDFDTILATANGKGNNGNGQGNKGQNKGDSNGNQNGNGRQGGNNGQGSGDGSGTCVNG